MKPLIYAVEDDESILDLYRYAIGSEFDVNVFETGKAFFEAVQKQVPDLILLDLMLPDQNGLEILSALKESARTAKIPVIIVSAKGDDISFVKGLNAGADDYMAKPFSILVLMARIKANLRKYNAQQKNVLQVGKFQLNFSNYKCFYDGQEIVLTLKEFLLLKELLQNVNVAVEREELLNRVWGYDYVGETRTLDNHMKTLRQKLELAGVSGDCIKTLRGVGYMMEYNE